MLNEDACWRAVVKKDKTENSRFFVGVLTTGVFCRPWCPARTPLRKNVRFYASPADALQDGLRPCRRCRPLDGAGEHSSTSNIATLCDYIRQHAGQALTLASLSNRTGLSRFHLQRSFKAIVGVTPKQYIDACRFRRLKGHLRRNASVTDAIYEAGFGSSSRVYERTDTRLGMTPAAYRAGGQGVTISCGSANTPLGLMMAGATDRGLCSIQFGDSHEQLLQMLRKEYPLATIQEMSKPYPKQFDLWMKGLSAHLEGLDSHLDLPVDVRATAFQLKVWRYLQSIPYGEVQSYAEVAGAIGQPKAARAVARACASNHVAIVIPCHRVIRGNSALGGYRWGLERKRALLDQERTFSTQRTQSRRRTKALQ